MIEDVTALNTDLTTGDQTELYGSSNMESLFVENFGESLLMATVWPIVDKKIKEKGEEIRNEQ